MKSIFDFINTPKTKNIESKIYITYTDISTTKKTISSNTILIACKSNKGHINQPIIVTPKVKPVKWYELWKDKQKYTDEVNRCKKYINTVFGIPNVL